MSKTAARHTSQNGILNSIREWVSERYHSPESWTSVFQLMKMVIAATVAWWISTEFLNTEFPFISPWIALLTVHATAYRSVSRAAQITVASLLGIALAFLVGEFLGVTVWTYALALTVGLLISRLKWIRKEGLDVATMSVFLLSDGFSEQQQNFSDRILELLLGAAVGVVVNLLLFAPMRDRQAGRFVDSVNRRIGDLLTSMSVEFHTSGNAEHASDWVEETRSMSDELDSAWSMVALARESRVANPRAVLTELTNPEDPGKASWEEILRRTDESISHLRNLARTLRVAYESGHEWDPDFADSWSELASEIAEAVADPDARVESFAADLDELSRATDGNDRISAEAWPVYGSLIMSLRHIVKIVRVPSAEENRTEPGDELP